MPRKYTDEQLSRILSTHEAKAPKTQQSLMKCGGLQWANCINQCAYPQTGHDNLLAAKRNRPAALWFDEHYDFAWTADELLAQLEANGFA